VEAAAHRAAAVVHPAVEAVGQVVDRDREEAVRVLAVAGKAAVAGPVEEIKTVEVALVVETTRVAVVRARVETTRVAEDVPATARAVTIKAADVLAMVRAEARGTAVKVEEVARVKAAVAPVTDRVSRRQRKRPIPPPEQRRLTQARAPGSSATPRA
jgi:hypothetical protein